MVMKEGAKRPSKITFSAAAVFGASARAHQSPPPPPATTTSAHTCPLSQVRLLQLGADVRCTVVMVEGTGATKVSENEVASDVVEVLDDG